MKILLILRFKVSPVLFCCWMDCLALGLSTPIASCKFTRNCNSLLTFSCVFLMPQIVFYLDLSSNFKKPGIFATLQGGLHLNIMRGFLKLLWIIFSCDEGFSHFLALNITSKQLLTDEGQTLIITGIYFSIQAS